MNYNEWILCQLPSGNSRFVLLQQNQQISLGKFGSFNVNQLINLPFDIPYQMEGDNIFPVDSPQLFDDFLLPSSDANNKFINQENSQLLSFDDINQLKLDSKLGILSPSDLIQQMAENNTSFNQRTEFSKAKYLKRKEQKFSKIFIPKLPTALNICNHFFTTKPEKSLNLRPDSLSQILSLANIHSSPSFKVLLVDDTNGVLTASILDRMGNQGHVTFISSDESASVLQATSTGTLEAIRFLPKDIRKWALGTDSTIIHGQASFPNPEPNGALTMMSFKQCHSSLNPPLEQVKKKRKSAISYRLDRNKKFFMDDGYDSLIIALPPTQPISSILNLLESRLKGGRPLVIYSPNKEPLPEIWFKMRTSPEWVNVNLHESWTREWQVKQGRGHPFMTGSGTGGFILSATRVWPDNLELGKKKKKREDVEENVQDGKEDVVKEVEEKGEKRNPSTSPTPPPEKRLKESE